MEKPLFWLIMLFLIFAPLLEGGQTYIAFMVYRLAILLLLTIFLLKGIKDNKLIVYRSGLEGPIFIFLLISLFATIRSPYLNMSLEWLLSIFFNILFFYLLLSIIWDKKEVSLILELLFCLGLVEAVFALFQFVIFDAPRAEGTFSNPNFLALFLIATGSLGIGELLANGSCLPHLPRPITGLILFLDFLAIMATGSRGAIVVLSVTLIFFYFVRFRIKFIWPALLLVTLAIFQGPIHERLFNSRIEDNLRPRIWTISFQEMIKHPLGIGLGMFKYYSAQFDLPVTDAIARYGKKAGSAHNDYLEIGVEAGVAGLLVFIWGIFCLAKNLINSYLSEAWHEQRGLLLGLSGSIIAIFVHTAFDMIFHEPAIIILLVTLTSLFLIVDRSKKWREPIVISPFPIRHPSMLIALSMVLSLLIIKPTFAWFLYEKGNKALERGDLVAAKNEFEWTVFFNKGNAYYHDTLAYTYFLAFKTTADYDWFNKAVSELEYAAFLNPLEGKFPASTGRLYHYLALKEIDPQKRNEPLQEALYYYQRGAQLHPFSPVRYNDLGLVYKALNRNELAAEQFERAIKIEPNFLQARVNLANFYKETGRYNDAIREFKICLSIKEKYNGLLLGPLEKEYLYIDEKHIQEELIFLEALR